ncbi:MAG: LysR family transcriptional regulator [Gammaproteobacteria bacterium]
MPIYIEYFDIKSGVDIEQARTFLAIAAHGSFLEAAGRLHVTQSTVSARIRALETELGAVLFVRNRSGAHLTAAGRRFVNHAQTLVTTLEQARHDVGLPDRFTGSLRIGGRIALWEGFLPRFVRWSRAAMPDVSVRADIGFEQDLMRRMVEGTLDIACMYTPTHAPHLEVEHLFDEQLVLVSTEPGSRWPGEDYIHVDWGPSFHARQREAFPDQPSPSRVVNIGWMAVQMMFEDGGSAYLPRRMAEPLWAAGRLHRVEEAPSFPHPAYMVFARSAVADHTREALRGLRELAAGEGGGA